MIIAVCDREKYNEGEQKYSGKEQIKTEEEVVRETELASEFCLVGMKHFLNIR